MKRSSKDLFDKRYRYSIRRLSVGTASVVVGCLLFGGAMVQANTLAPSDLLDEATTKVAETGESDQENREAERMDIQSEPELRHPENKVEEVLVTNKELGLNEEVEERQTIEIKETEDSQSVSSSASRLQAKDEDRSLAEIPKVQETTPDGQVNAVETWNKISHITATDQSIQFDNDWKFSLGEQANASRKDYDDSSWQRLDLPHDFSLTQEYTPAGEAESGYKLGGTGWYRKNFTVSQEVADGRVELHFDGAYMETEVFVNGTSLGVHPNGYSPFTFDLTGHIRANEENTLAVKVVNTTPSSRWYSGSGIYRSVNLNVTPKVHLAEYGVVVKTPNLKQAIDNQTDVHMEVVTTVANSSAEQANVRVKTILFERGLNGEVGQQVAETTSEVSSVTRDGQVEILSRLNVSRPKLWSVETPNLYIVRTEVYQGDKRIQARDQETGFRFIEFDKDAGFKLNGKSMKLQGVSMHHDQGSLGAKAYYDAIERQFDILKDMGVNAVRVTHNPAARAMKDIANRKGMLLIDEAFDTWEHAKNGNTYDYARFFNASIGSTANKLIGAQSENQTWAEFHTKQMVKSGINDPSIIMWSTGNEVMEGFSANVDNYPQVIAQLIRWITEVDNSRPATIGDNKLKANWAQAIGMANVLTENKGIVGFNYADGSQYDAARRENPNWIIYGSETASSINSRGVYNVKDGRKRGDKQLTSYDQSKVGWGHFASEAWYDTIVRDFVAGEFVWTGFDYLGEPTPWNNISSGPTEGWPSPKSSYFGIVDTAGFPKDSYYFYRSQWNKKDTTLHVLPAWEESMVSKDRQNQVEVVVYSNAAKVKLVYVNKDGQEEDLGSKEFSKQTTAAGFEYQLYDGNDKSSQAHKNLYLTWHVPYRPGKIKAIAYDKDGIEITRTVGNKEVQTFTEASKLVAKVHKQPTKVHDQSLAYIEIDVQDKLGNLVANANLPVTIQVEGPAQLVAMDNGNPMDHQSYQDTNRKTFGGKVLAIVKMDGSAGTIRVTASAAGLESAKVDFTVSETTSSTEKVATDFKLSKTIYIKRGAELTLPTHTKVRYSDKSEETKKLLFDKEQLQRDIESGVHFTAHGTIEELGLPADILVAVIDKVAAMKNISQAVEVNNKPILPDKVQGFLADGSLLSSEFPVVWQMPADSQFAQEGLVLITGLANVLGEELPVTASVRVGRKTITVDQNVAPSVANLTQSIETSLQSDTLDAIKDGNKIPSSNHQGGPNQTIWSNYTAAQKGQTRATLTFAYDTAQNIGEVVAYYHRDYGSLRNPKSVQFEWSRGANDSTETIAAREINKETIGTVTKVTYRLDTPVPAVIFKMTVENADKEPGMSAQASVGIVELELKTVLERFTQQSDAKINEVTFGNRTYSGREVSTNMTISGSGPLTARHTHNNPGITILKLSETTYKIFTESEDKTQTEVYTLTVVADSPTTVGRNYINRDQVVLTAGSTEPRAGNEVTNAKDFNLNTIWHSSWNGASLSDLWIAMDTGSLRQLNGIAYMHRKDGSPNGKVKDYEVLVSSDNQTWTRVATGRFEENNTDWQEVVFEPVTARHVKLQAVSTLGDGGRPNIFMSANEIRVSEFLGEVETVTLLDEHVTLPTTNYIYTGRAHTPKPKVVVNGRTLLENTDYRLTYANNTGQVGQTSQATVIVIGTGNYTGAVRKLFTITAGNQAIVSDGTVETAENFVATKPASSADFTTAKTSQDYLTKNYTIFPSPQKVTYGSGVVALEGQVNLVIGDGIDIYTRNRLKDTLQAHQISYVTSPTAVENGTNIYIGIQGAPSVAATHQATASLATDLFEKIDAYSLVIKGNAISVVGKDTDAVFYGLTTLKHMLNESPVPVLREVTVEDFADIKNRGFIEGYYGNPWSKEDRMELMRYGGDIKLTQYFFAPKDDEYHNSRWRDLYPEEKLAEIREMARVGNQNKTRYVWTLHPFMHKKVRFDSEQTYQTDLTVIKNKFTQLMDAGVREFGILADDAPNPVGGHESYNRLMSDLTSWLESKQGEYLGLRKEMIFVPHEYWGDGDEAELRSLNEKLPESSMLTLTGGRIWGEVSSNFLNRLKTNLEAGNKTYRPIQFWLNWPCTDNSKEHLILGGGEKFLHPGIDPTLVGGIMLNPMQQSEPSKLALFSAAEYTWNVWATEEAARRVNDIGFNFIETGRFTETAESRAFRELGKHMINQNMDGRVVKLEESIELAPKLTTFTTKLAAGEDVTEERKVLRQEFAKLKEAAQTYKESGNERIRGQISYWLENTIDQMTALDSLLTATEFIGKDSAQLWNHYYQGLTDYEQSKTHTFWYVNHYEKAELGVQHIRPFILSLLERLANEVEHDLYPDRVSTRFISNRTGAEGSLEQITDGDLSTQLIFKNPTVIRTNDYVGLEFSKPIAIHQLAFAMGAVSNLRDTFNTAAIEYLNEDGQWTVLEGHGFQGNEAILELTNLEIKAKGVRMRATTDRTNTWFGVREIAVNRPLETGRQHTVSISHSPNLVYKLNHDERLIKDNNDNTEAMLANSDGQDNTPVDAWVQLDLGSTKPIASVRLLQGTDDKLASGVIEYSHDGQEWINLANLTGEQLKEVHQDFEARYIRARNTQPISLWWRIKDFSVVTNEGTTELTDTNDTALEKRPTFVNLGHYKLSLEANHSLAPNAYIGLKLDRLHEVENLLATGTKLNLYYSPNAVEWYAANDLTKQPLARYIRLVNTGKEAEVIGTDSLIVKTKEVHPDKLKSTTMGINPYYGANDVRNIHNLDQLFDGVYNNTVEFADTPRQGGEIVIELGVQRPIHKLRAYIQDATQNYLRDGKIQLSADGKEWIDIVTVGDGLSNAAKDDSLGDGWIHDSNKPGNRYVEGSLETPVNAKYMRVYFTAHYNHRFVSFTEIVLNDGEYVPLENNPTVQGEAKESHDNLLTHLVDGKVLTTYLADAAKGNLTYHLSEATEANHIKLISNLPQGATAKVSARLAPVQPAGYHQKVDSKWVDLGEIASNLQTFIIREDASHLLDVKIEWQGGKAEFYELSTYKAPIENQPDQPQQPEAPSKPEQPQQPDSPLVRELVDAKTGLKLQLSVGEKEQIVAVKVTHKETGAENSPTILSNEDYDLYDIVLLDKEGHVIENQKDVQVFLPVDEGKEVLKVIYLPNSNQAEELMFTEHKGTNDLGKPYRIIMFTAKHFSEYGLVYKKVTAKGESVTTELPVGQVPSDKPTPHMTSKGSSVTTPDLPKGVIPTSTNLATSESNSSSVQENTAKSSSMTVNSQTLPTTGEASSDLAVTGLTVLSMLGVATIRKRRL